MKIAVEGLGCVGLSNAVLFAQNHQVIATDSSVACVDAVNMRHSPIADPDIQDFFANRVLNLSATIDPKEA